MEYKWAIQVIVPKLLRYMGSLHQSPSPVSRPAQGSGCLGLREGKSVPEEKDFKIGNLGASLPGKHILAFPFPFFFPHRHASCKC